MHEHVLQGDQPIEMRADLEVAPPREAADVAPGEAVGGARQRLALADLAHHRIEQPEQPPRLRRQLVQRAPQDLVSQPVGDGDNRKSTRLNSSHITNSYAVFCVKKKTKYNT